MSGGTIQARALTCQRLFMQCLSLIHTEHIAWFEMRLGEFNIWAYGLQALSSGKSSLDYRVRTRSDVGEILLALLGGLSEVLEDCIRDDIKLPSEGTDDVVSVGLKEEDGKDFDFVDFSDDEDTSKIKSLTSEEGLFSLQMYNIKTVIAQLTRFSSMIRRSGTKFRFKRADATLALRKSEFDEFQKHLTSIILIRSTKFDVGDPKSFEGFQEKSGSNLLTPVQRRLIHGNILRRNRIREATKNVWSAERQEKGELKELTHDLKFVVPDMTAEATAPTPTPTSQSKAAQSRTDGTVKSIARSKVESTAQSATEIGSRLGLQVAPPKAAPSVVTKVTNIGINQDYPKCPKPISDDFVQCPYCADMLPAEYRNSSSRWRGHVAQDILPYMCIYEHCPLADEMYLTSEEFIGHVRDHHATTMWACNSCLPKASEAETYVFESSAHWQEHMLQAHGGLIPLQQLSSLARVSERQVVQAVSCPLCSYTPAEAQTTVDQHILQHLHEFALRSLPPRADHDPEGSSSDNSVGGLSTKSDDDDTSEEEPQASPLDGIRQDLVLLCENLLELGKKLIMIDFNKLPAGTFEFEDVQRKCAVIRDNTLLCSKEPKKFWDHLQQDFPAASARLQVMVPAANDLLLSLFSEATIMSIELVFADLYTDLLLPLMIEVEFILDESRRHRSLVNVPHNPLPIVEEFDLTFPTEFRHLSSQYNEDTDLIKKLKDFVYGKQNGVFALLNGEMNRAFSALTYFARRYEHNYLEQRKLFYVNSNAVQFRSIESISDLDRVFGKIATELLEMPDLLDILAAGDRGSALVEAILRVANEKAKAPWILIIHNIPIPLGEFLRHDMTESQGTIMIAHRPDYLRLPKLPVQGSVIITSPEPPQLPEELDVHIISQELEPPSGTIQDSYRPFRAPTAPGYVKRSTTRGDVTVHQENARGYNASDPHPPYSSKPGRNDVDSAAALFTAKISAKPTMGRIIVWSQLIAMIADPSSAKQTHQGDLTTIAKNIPRNSLVVPPSKEGSLISSAEKREGPMNYGQSSGGSDRGIAPGEGSSSHTSGRDRFDTL